MTKPSYGVDKPAFTQLAAGLGVAGIVAGIEVSRARPHWLGAIVALLGLLALIAGAAMILYNRTGRLRVRDRMLSMIDWRGDERVLDLGTGRGLLAVGAARKTHGGVTGYDHWDSAEESNRTRANAESTIAAEGAHVVLVEGGPSPLPFVDGQFDVVVGLLWLTDVPGEERDAALRESARVLAPGGALVLGDYAGVGAAARTLRAAGLAVEPPLTAAAAAMIPLRLLRAHKPRVGGA